MPCCVRFNDLLARLTLSATCDRCMCWDPKKLAWSDNKQAIGTNNEYLQKQRISYPILSFWKRTSDSARHRELDWQWCHFKKDRRIQKGPPYSCRWCSRDDEKRCRGILMKHMDGTWNISVPRTVVDDSEQIIKEQSPDLVLNKLPWYKNKSIVLPE